MMTIVCILFYLSIAAVWFCFDLMMSVHADKNFIFKSATFTSLCWPITAGAVVYVSWKNRDDFANLEDGQ